VSGDHDGTGAGWVGAEREDDDAAAAVDTLRELGEHLVDSARDDAQPAGPTVEQGASALLSSLAVDAVIATNETVGQHSLREFLR
jgi:hypothetical protein